MSVYKKFTAQDFAIVPFNAHKQYDFVSSSASENKVNHYSARWTSESISFYSSASTNPDGLFDPINTIKYNQIDHLFYKNFKTSHANRFGNFNYLDQKRELYEKANILSIPSGLYGHEIKPTSFYLSSSDQHIVDDGKGNLIISGTNVNNYPIDVRSNLFRLDPIKGFKLYDLGVFPDYAIKLRDPQGKPYEVIKQFYRQGQVNPNAPILYTSPTSSIDIDDSYFFNRLKFNNIRFSPSSFLGSLESPLGTFSTMNFNAITGSYIVSPDDTKYDFNRGDDFAVSFYIKPKIPVDLDNETGVGIGQPYGGGIVFAIDEEEEMAYIVYPEIQTLQTQFQGGYRESLNFVNNTNFSLEAGDALTLVGEPTKSGYNHYSFRNLDDVNSIENRFNLRYLEQNAAADAVYGNAFPGYINTSSFPNTIGRETDTMEGLFGPGGNFDPPYEGGLAAFYLKYENSKVTTLASGSTILGSGETNTNAWLNPTQDAQSLPVIEAVKNSNAGGFSDWWLPSYDEMNEIYKVFGSLNADGAIYAQPYQDTSIGLTEGLDFSTQCPGLSIFCGSSANVMGTTFNCGIEGIYMPPFTFRLITDIVVYRETGRQQGLGQMPDNGYAGFQGGEPYVVKTVAFPPNLVDEPMYATHTGFGQGTTYANPGTTHPNGDCEDPTVVVGQDGWYYGYFINGITGFDNAIAEHVPQFYNGVGLPTIQEQHMLLGPSSSPCSEQDYINSYFSPFPGENYEYGQNGTNSLIPWFDGDGSPDAFTNSNNNYLPNQPYQHKIRVLVSTDSEGLITNAFIDNPLEDHIIYSLADAFENKVDYQRYQSFTILGPEDGDLTGEDVTNGAGLNIPVGNTNAGFYPTVNAKLMQQARFYIEDYEEQTGIGFMFNEVNNVGNSWMQSDNQDFIQGDFDVGGFLENDRDLGIQVGGTFTDIWSGGSGDLVECSRDLVFYTSNGRIEDGVYKEVMIVPSKAPRKFVGDFSGENSIELGADFNYLYVQGVIGNQSEVANNTFTTTRLLGLNTQIVGNVADAITLNVANTNFGSSAINLVEEDTAMQGSYISGGGAFNNQLATSPNLGVTPNGNLPYYPMRVDFENKPPKIVGIEFRVEFRGGIAQVEAPSGDYNTGDPIYGGFAIKHMDGTWTQCGGFGNSAEPIDTTLNYTAEAINFPVWNTFDPPNEAYIQLLEGAVIKGEDYYTNAADQGIPSNTPVIVSGDPNSFYPNSASINSNQTGFIENVKSYVAYNNANTVNGVNDLFFYTQNDDVPTPTGLHFDITVATNVPSIIDTGDEFFTQTEELFNVVDISVNESSLESSFGYSVGDVIGILGGGQSGDNLGSTLTAQITHIEYEEELMYSPAAHLLVRKQSIAQTTPMDNNKRYIISKSTTKTEIPPVTTTTAGGGSAVLNTNVEGNSQTANINSETQFPFEIYMQSSSIYFDRYDGDQKISISGFCTNSAGETAEQPFHILCQSSASVMELYINSNKVASASDTTKRSTQNRANLYIGAKGDKSDTSALYGIENVDAFYHGELSHINIWDKSFAATSSIGSTINGDYFEFYPIQLMSESVNNSPYIGNIFYQNGFATITHPKYFEILGDFGVGDLAIEDMVIVEPEAEFGINVLQFQGSHLIYEHEYQCTVDEHEYNDTLNTTARKIASNKNYELADFTTSSLFKPYVTTIGLYNDEGELLVVGKLGQPIRTSNETDTTFIVRWDS